MKKRNLVLAFVSLFSMLFSVPTSFVSASENVNVETFETDELIELTSEFGETLISRRNRRIIKDVLKLCKWQ